MPIAGAVVVFGLPVVILSGAEAVRTAANPTFHEDVLPILQRRCQTCHRPGEVAPMSLLNYDQVRPWAKAMKSAVLQKRMPPWFADSRYGDFRNDSSLTKQEIDTLVSWADHGAAAGAPDKAPEPRAFADGWTIGDPNAILEIPTTFHVPASGDVAYQYIQFPSGFTEDKWVRAVEIRPGNRTVVHHQIATARPHDPEERMKHGEYVERFSRREGDGAERPQSDQPPAMFADQGEQLQVYTPGGVPPSFADDQAKLVKAGSDLFFQLHYTTTGKPETDVTRIGFIFAKEPPKKRVRGVLVYNTRFTIPAGRPKAMVTAQAEVVQPVELISLLPHMHLRGKFFEYQAFYPNGEVETLLSVPKYDFNWQLSYYLKEPKLLPKGTILRCVGYYDNSENNPWNPNPRTDVSYGPQTWEEMLNGFMEVALAPDAESERVFQSVSPERAAELPAPGPLTASNQ